MNIKLFQILFAFLVFNMSYCQSKSPFILQGDFVKHMEFKDSIRPSDKKVYEKCKKWILQNDVIYRVLQFVKPITSEEKGGLYNSLPCYYQGRVLYKNQKYIIEINAASYITLYNDKAIIYFGCAALPV